MLTRRDKDILIFLEKYFAITTTQARKIFFNNDYKSTSRRLNALEQQGILTHYYSDRNKVYRLVDENKTISKHDLLIIDFYAHICELGGQVIEFIKTPCYFNKLLIPDALFKFKLLYQGQNYMIDVLLEIDYTHYTENIKLNTWYEKLYREEILKDFCKETEFPIVVICRSTPGIRYNSNNFNIVYTDLKFTNLINLIFQGEG